MKGTGEQCWPTRDNGAYDLSEYKFLSSPIMAHSKISVTPGQWISWLKSLRNRPVTVSKTTNLHVLFADYSGNGLSAYSFVPIISSICSVKQLFKKEELSNTFQNVFSYCIDLEQTEFPETHALYIVNALFKYFSHESLATYDLLRCTFASYHEKYKKIEIQSDGYEGCVLFLKFLKKNWKNFAEHQRDELLDILAWLDVGSTLQEEQKYALKNALSEVGQ